MRIWLAFVIALLPLPAAAAPTPLGSTIARVEPDPPAIIAPLDSGKTVLDRYRARAKPTSGTPLVVIVRLPDANSPDTVAVTHAIRDGQHVKIAIETRRFEGPVAANVVTTPLVEIALGDLPRGAYTIDIEEQILRFTKYGAPQTAANARFGLRSSISLTVQ